LYFKTIVKVHSFGKALCLLYILFVDFSQIQFKPMVISVDKRNKFHDSFSYYAVRRSGRGGLGYLLNDFFQFPGEFLGDRLIFYVFADCNGSFQGFQASKAGNAVFSVFFDLGTADMIQFAVNIFRKLLKHLQTMGMVMIITGHFQNILSIYLLNRAWHGGA
jgi:hypothetical protein